MSTGNTVIVDATKGVTVLAQVYYLTVTVLDSRFAPVPEAEIVAESLAGRAFTAAVSDGGGQAVLRVPATQVRLTARSLGVDVGSMTMQVTGDASVSFNVDVFTLDLTVIDGNGGSLPGAQIAIEADGRIFAFEVADAGGQLSVRLPVGTYTVRARFTAEYLYTHVDASSEATVALTSDVERTIQIGAYPPSVTGTVAFGFGLLAAALAAGLSWTFYTLGKRRGKTRASLETSVESEKGGETK